MHALNNMYTETLNLQPLSRVGVPATLSRVHTGTAGKTTLHTTVQDCTRQNRTVCDRTPEH